jgi:hypothetical protein
MPDLLERAVTGELGGVVTAVVVEALFSTDIPDQGLGHRHPLEASRGKDRLRRPGGLDFLRLAHLDRSSHWITPD